MSSKYLRRDLQNLKPYMVDRANYKIRLDANESFIKLDENLLEEMKETVNSALFNRYPDADSERVCALYANYAGILPENVMAGNGSDELIQIIVNTFVEQGEKVVMLNPDFSMYSFYTMVGGGIPVFVETDEEFQVNAQKLIDKIREVKPKMVILSNPSNPTGGIIEREKLIRLVEESSCLVVIDEAYYEFYRESLVDVINRYDNLIILRTCSKAVGMAAIRLGFLLTNIELLKELKSVKPPFNVNSISQSFGEVVLNNKQVIDINSYRIIQSRELLLEELSKFKQLKLFKTKANFVFLRYEKAEALNKELLKSGIKIRSFGNGRLKNCVRITIGNKAQNKELIEVMEKFLAKGGN
jgi:histidinol-phosphate aminotransferase